MQNEIWKPVKGYEGFYEASNLGRIRSSKSKRILSQHMINSGYLSARLRNGKRTVHALVALAFLGDRPQGLVVDHIDHCKTNNRADNLRYITYSENIYRSVRCDLNPNKSSRSRGVYLNKKDMLWIARAHSPQGRKYLGCYKIEDDAIEAVNKFNELQKVTA